MGTFKIVILLGMVVIECSGTSDIHEKQRYEKKLLGGAVTEYLNNNSIAYALQGYVINAPRQRCVQHTIDITQTLLSVKRTLLPENNVVHDDYKRMVDIAMAKVDVEFKQELLTICNTSTSIHEGLEAEFRRGTVAERNKRVAFAVVGGVALAVIFVSWLTYVTVKQHISDRDSKDAFQAGKEHREELQKLLDEQVRFDRELRRQLLQLKIDQFLSQSLTELTSLMKEMLIGGVPDVRIFPIADLETMLKRDMGMALWRQSVYAVEPYTMYGLSSVKPVSCEAEAKQISVEICYPVVKKSEISALFHVMHRGAFNTEENVFGYANIAEHIAVPLKDAVEARVSDVKTVDLGRCELRFGRVFVCRGFGHSDSDHCCLNEMANCTWHLSPVTRGGFVDVRVIGDRYLIATTAQKFLRVSADRQLKDEGREEQVRSKIFELHLFDEGAIIGHQYLSPISAMTRVKGDFWLPTLELRYGEVFDQEDQLHKLVKLTREVSEATHKYAVATKKFAEDVEEVIDLSFFDKILENWKMIIFLVCGTLLVVGVFIFFICLMSSMGWCCCFAKCK